MRYDSYERDILSRDLILSIKIIFRILEAVQKFFTHEFTTTTVLQLFPVLPNSIRFPLPMSIENNVGNVSQMLSFLTTLRVSLILIQFIVTGFNRVFISNQEKITRLSQI